jgi:uncharacterized protein
MLYFSRCNIILVAIFKFIRIQEKFLLSNPRSPFRLNVGFIVHQNIGFSRDFPFDIPKIHLPPDLDLGDFTGTARVTRTPQGLLVQVKMRANLLATCVRCLKDYNQHLEIEFTELYAFSKRSTTDSDLLLPEDGYIDLGALVREYMLLEVPINSLCKPDCKGLCPVCGENLNEVACDHDDETSDPRLSVLKSLLDDEETPET